MPTEYNDTPSGWWAAHEAKQARKQRESWERMKRASAKRTGRAV